MKYNTIKYKFNVKNLIVDKLYFNEKSLLQVNGLHINNMIKNFLNTKDKKLQLLNHINNFKMILNSKFQKQDIDKFFKFEHWPELIMELFNNIEIYDQIKYHNYLFEQLDLKNIYEEKLKLRIKSANFKDEKIMFQDFLIQFGKEFNDNIDNFNRDNINKFFSKFLFIRKQYLPEYFHKILKYAICGKKDGIETSLIMLYIGLEECLLRLDLFLTYLEKFEKLTSKKLIN